MITLEKVSKHYMHDGGRLVQAVSEVDLVIAPGEFVCVLGPSGCGKSTLLNLIAGFERPDSGRVLFRGRPVMRPGPDRGVVFQDPTLFPWLTARQNVEFGLENLGFSGPERRVAAEKHLHLVGLREFADVRPHALSGGMRQRVALARVLAMRPDALLMDEPFGALDALTRVRLQEELSRIWETDRRTVLFVTHSIEEAVWLADRVVLMGPGPRSVRSLCRITLERPRDRMSAGFRELVERFDRALRRMPCCLTSDGVDCSVPVTASQA